MDTVIRRRRRWVGVAAVLALGMICCAVSAQGWPTVRAIAFSGNRVTRPQVMLREMTIHVGDPADPVQIERSRQAILDLGLFRSVAVRDSRVKGGVKLTFVVREKWYLLPLPRLELSPNGGYGYGGQLRWNNVWGLNHTLRLLLVQSHRMTPGHSGNFEYSGSYTIPFLDGSRYGLSLSGAHGIQDATDAVGDHYTESYDNARLMLTRALSSGPRSQGWNAGTGLAWQRENTGGGTAPLPQGKALALVGTLVYNELHDQVYGEYGTQFSAQAQHAFHGLDSDYSFSLYSLDYLHAWQIGTTPYQDLRLLADTGLYSGGPPGVTPLVFSLGGSHQLRGYPSQFVEGDFSYYLAGEFLRPIGWNWLRFLAFAEAGSVWPRFGHSAGRPTYVSVGIGLRLRVVWLVNLDLEAGVAFPLVDGTGRGWRAFAGSG